MAIFVVTTERGLKVVDLLDAFLMSPAIKRCAEEDRHDFLRKREGDNPTAHRQDVCVVVSASHSSGIELVAKSCSNPPYLVRCELLALSAATNHNTEVSIAITNMACYGGTDRWIIDSFDRPRTVILDLVTEVVYVGDNMALEFEASMI